MTIVALRSLFAEGRQSGFRQAYSAGYEEFAPGALNGAKYIAPCGAWVILPLEISTIFAEMGTQTVNN